MGNYQGSRNRQNSQQLDVSYSNEFELSADGGDGEEDKCLSKKVNEKKLSSSSSSSKKKSSENANNGDWKYVLDNDDDLGVFNSGNSCVEEKEVLFNEETKANRKPSQSDDLDLDYHTTEDDDQQFNLKNNYKSNGDSMRNLIDDAPLLAIDADDVDDGVYMSKCLNDNNKHSSTETVTSSTTTTTRSSSSPSSLASSNRGVNLIDDGDDIDKFIKYELNGKATTTATTGVRPTLEQQQQRSSGIDDFDSDIEKLKSSLLLGSKLGEASVKAKLHSASDSVLSPIPPPPCTPVSGPLSIEKETVIQPTLATTVPAYRNQQLIEDVILLDESDRGLVPLAQQEEHSFNSLDSSSNNLPANGEEEASTQNLELLLEQLNINNPEPVPVKPEPSEPQVSDPLTKLLNQLASTNLIVHRFEYTAANEDVHDVKLTGSFNNWSEFLQLTKDDKIENKWFREIYLAPGEYEYKYKVNDEWKCDENSEARGINNYINLAKASI